jgi:glycosyltransferase involved in cell wall biosynthesis
VNIALITGIFPPDIGGPASFVPKLAQYLGSRAHNVKVITLANQPKITSTSNDEVIRVKRTIFIPLRFIIVLLKIIVLPSGTILFANGLHQEVGISLLLRKRKAVAKIVGDPVWERARNKGETNLSIEEFNSSRLGNKHLLQRKLLVFALNRFQLVTCPSKELCTLVEKWGVKKSIVYIGNGVNLDFDDSSSEKEFDLICVSRLVPWKNIETHIEIAAALNLRILVIGSGPLESKLKNLATSLNCKATFSGEKSTEEVKQLMRRSKVFILLSSYEGMSFALLEAMAIGLPSIVSDIAANKEVISHRNEGLVINSSDWRSQLYLVEEMFRNSDVYLSYSMNAKNKVKNEFEETSQLRKMEELLK